MEIREITSYTFTNEQGRERTIHSLEQAQTIICATAMVRCHNHETILEDEQLVKVATAFGINLKSIKIEESKCAFDFPYIFSF